jgi:hypothetical protein
VIIVGLVFAVQLLDDLNAGGAAHHDHDLVILRATGNAGTSTSPNTEILMAVLRCAASLEVASFMAASTLWSNSGRVGPIRTRGRKKSAHRNSANAVGVFAKPPASRT